MVTRVRRFDQRKCTSRFRASAGRRRGGAALWARRPQSEPGSGRKRPGINAETPYPAQPTCHYRSKRIMAATRNQRARSTETATRSNCRSRLANSSTLKPRRMDSRASWRTPAGAPASRSVAAREAHGERRRSLIRTLQPAQQRENLFIAEVVEAHRRHSAIIGLGRLMGEDILLEQFHARICRPAQFLPRQAHRRLGHFKAGDVQGDGVRPRPPAHRQRNVAAPRADVENPQRGGGAASRRFGGQKTADHPDAPETARAAIRSQ
jgi:hypothetical protein